MIEYIGKYTKAKVMIDEIDGTTSSQINEFINHRAFTNPIAIMPDTHAGKGAVIGFTMELTDKVIPNVIGVDINCAVLSIKIGKKLFDNITREEFDVAVREAVPFGSNVRETVHKEVKFDWKLINEEIRLFTLKFNKRFNCNETPVVMDDEVLVKLCTKVGAQARRVMQSIGTLGGGNHFIEVGKDENGDYWITIHTGSRNFGKCIAEYHQDIALKRMTEPKMSKVEYVDFVKENFPKKKWQEEIGKYDKFMGGKSYVPKGTEYLEGSDMYAYLVDMMVAQEYAKLNRKIIAHCIQDIIMELDSDVLVPVQTEYVDTAHNFIDFDDWIIRKGAVRSYKDELFVLPFNMEDGLLICKGKSNPEWNYSAPHGAGRLFSRSHAKKTLSIGKAKRDMADKDIYSSVIPLDECKDAYKDAELLEILIEDTADIVHRVKPVLNMKSKG